MGVFVDRAYVAAAMVTDTILAIFILRFKMCRHFDTRINFLLGPFTALSLSSRERVPCGLFILLIRLMGSVGDS